MKKLLRKIIELFSVSERRHKGEVSMKNEKKKVEVPSLSKKVSWNCSLQTQGPQFQHKVTVVGCCIAEKNTLGSFQMTKGIGQVFTYLNGVPLRKKRNNY